MYRFLSRGFRGALTSSKRLPSPSTFNQSVKLSKSLGAYEAYGVSVIKSSSRLLHSTTRKLTIRPFILADIGEGITECQVIEWFVKPGDKVEQFDPVCEVQSDKASVEITSRFDGTITRLHYKVGDVATVGEPLVDIDMGGADDGEEIAPKLSAATERNASESKVINEQQQSHKPKETTTDTRPEIPVQRNSTLADSIDQLVAPAIRYQLKTLGINASDVIGTGKNGRITKDDVQRHVDTQALSKSESKTSEDHVLPLTAIEKQMFQTMTKSLAIPQFLYTHSVDTSSLSQLRQRANDASQGQPESVAKITTLPFIMKAISNVFARFPKMNAHLEAGSDANKAQLVLKSSHNFGIAIDTPQGLLVPIVKGVELHSVRSLTVEIGRLSELARAGRLHPDDFKHGTFIISNIGSIGGSVVSPVIVPPMVGIVGIGREQSVPAFDEDGNIVPQRQTMLSWSADHRILDGATVARCAEAVSQVLQDSGQLEAFI
ncbi:2-oxoacid dehydrogenases acyltransferase-domain-containing protein [Mariannaea sp. PMI_226]|nr:2-oxoacid dehydrogenases acyltransferase-domain-containing protein [Mariannaea sp. PMI_226]